MKLADLDLDGDLDVVCALSAIDRVIWYANNGAGVFSEQRVICSDARLAQKVASADINGDGLPDVVVADNERLRWFAQTGEGEFEAEFTLADFEPQWRAVVCADFDGDQDIDVVASCYASSSVYLFENLGGGSFDSPVVLSDMIGNGSDLCAVDLDGDDDLDVLVGHGGGAGPNTFDAQYFLNQGDGMFALPVSFGQNYTTKSLRAADLDNDGDQDVVCSKSSAFGDAVLMIEQDLALDFSHNTITQDVNQVYAVEIADVNGDGLLDVLSASLFDNKLAWYPNLGSGDFDEQIVLPHSALGAFIVCAGDLDGDQDIDVMLCSVSDGRLTLLRNTGGGDFGPEEIVDQSENSNVSCIALCDIEGDGDLDVVATSDILGTLAVHPNDGEGGFEQPMSILVHEIAREVAADDLDGDGDTDLISLVEVPLDEGNLIRVYAHLNLGDGETFTTVQLYEDDGVFYNSSSGIQFEDVNGDGIRDVICNIHQSFDLLWIPNVGDGSFGPAVQIVSGTVHDFATSDVDGDGDLDALYSGGNTGWGLYWAENDGGGNFVQEHLIHDVGFARSLRLGDMDGDGYEDIITGYAHESIGFYKHDGTAGFHPLEFTGSELGLPRELALADMDNDGDIDILIAGSDYGRVAWMKNLGGAVFAQIEVLATGGSGGYASLVTGDLDADGDIDIAASYDSSDHIFWIANALGEGCTNAAACNYDPSAWISNDSCCFQDCGCTQPLAANYSPEAICDDGSCEYRISGVVFFDQNEDGILDDGEPLLPFQTVEVAPLDLLLITNDEGYYEFTSTLDAAILTLQPNPVFPYSTTPNPVYFYPGLSETTTFNFGISNEYPDFGICVDLYPSGNGFLCNEWSTHNICFRNMGNVTIDGIVELEYDALFQAHQEITPIDSTDGNKVYMSFEGLAPGAMFFYDVGLLTPTVDHIGEWVASHARVTGFYDGAEVAYGEKELTMEITCAYDPNDKQAFPLGYTDEHRLLQETEQEFLIRFQNTGNAPAQDVVIRDTLDVHFDLESFKLVANSHSVMTTLDATTRVVEFVFADIQLPDSTNNEPESHGMISYKITPLPDLPAQTVLYNTAYIYFDNNPPIVTNTTWTTIHECGGEAAYEVSYPGYCIGEPITWTSTAPWVEDYAWDINGETGVQPEFNAVFDQAGTYALAYTASNPLCAASVSTEFVIGDAPDAQVTASGIALVSNAGDTYQWFLDGESIPGATSQTWLPEVSGAYAVMVTTSGGCSTLSAPVEVTPITLGEAGLLLYPNPASGNATVAFSDDQPREVLLLDASGKQVRKWTEVHGYSLSFGLDGLAAGSYVIQVIEAGGSLTQRLMIH